MINKIKNKMIILFCLLGVMFSQDEMGLGFDFHMMPPGFIMNYLDEGVEGVGISFPFKTKGFLIEPSISYYKSTKEMSYNNFNDEMNFDYSQDYTDEEAYTTLSVGVFKTLSSNKSTYYAGIRIGQMKSTSERDYRAPELSENDEKNETESFIFVPTVGAEYYINDMISFGAEAMYINITSEDDDYYNNYGNNNDDGEWNSTQTISFIMPRFIIRFYFAK